MRAGEIAARHGGRVVLQCCRFFLILSWLSCSLELATSCLDFVYLSNVYLTYLESVRTSDLGVCSGILPVSERHRECALISS